jgi:hypothetical protein
LCRHTSAVRLGGDRIEVTAILQNLSQQANAGWIDRSRVLSYEWIPSHS